MPISILHIDLHRLEDEATPEWQHQSYPSFGQRTSLKCRHYKRLMCNRWHKSEMFKLWLCTTRAELCKNQWLTDGNCRCWNLTGTSSTSTLRKTRSVYFLLSSVKIGAMSRHGPHQVAVKSTTTLNRIKKNHQHHQFTLYAHETKKQPINKSSSSRYFTTLPWLLASSTLVVQVLLLLITMTLPWSPAISWGTAPDRTKYSQFEAVIYRIPQTENHGPLDYNKEQTNLRNYDKEKVTIYSHLRKTPSTNWEYSETSAGHTYQKTLSWCDTNKTLYYI